MHEAIGVCCQRENLQKTVAIALVVGSVLLLINQADVILQGEATARTWLKVALSYCVPFIVSNLGLLAGRRTEAESQTAGGTEPGTFR